MGLERVYQDVDFAQGFQRSSDGLLTVFVLSDIGREEMTFPALGLDSLLGLLCVVFFSREIDDEAVGTLLRKENGDCSSNATVTTYIVLLTGNMSEGPG